MSCLWYHMPRNSSFVVLICDPNCTTIPAFAMPWSTAQFLWFAIQTNLARTQHYFSENDPECNRYSQRYLNYFVHISAVEGLTYKVSLYFTEPLNYRSVASPFWYQLLLVPGVLVFPGDAVRLSCPNGPYSSMYWALDDDPYKRFEMLIVSYAPGSTLMVKEPWKSRGWNVDTTSSELVIPEVLLSDEDEYYCGPTGNLRRVTLSVHGEF